MKIHIFEYAIEKIKLLGYFAIFWIFRTPFFRVVYNSMKFCSTLQFSIKIRGLVAIIRKTKFHDFKKISRHLQYSSTSTIFILFISFNLLSLIYLIYFILFI